MKYLFFLLLCVVINAQEASPITPAPTRWITELGLTFPIKNNSIKNYVESHGIVTLPLTSGVSNGAAIGRHAVISDQATIGLLMGANMFIGTDSVAVSQLYQLSAFVTGRLYFGESWRGGAFVEIGSGPELSMAKLRGTPLVFQVNIGARIGLGYNYRFSNDVTVGASIVAAPALSAGSLMDGMKVAVSMLW